MTTDRIPLALLARELHELTGAEPPGYRPLLGLALDGKLAAQRINGRWYVHRRDLSAIAEALGLEPPDEPKPTHRRAA